MDSLAAGRTPADLASTSSGEDLLVASMRYDGSRLANKDIRHSTFVNVSFLESRVDHATFLDCIFINCYFRKATISSSSFVGSRFLNCNFDHLSLGDTDLRYASFHGCFPPFDEVQFSAPSEPNLRRDLFQGLARAAASGEDESEARRYRLAAIAAQNEDLRAAVKRQSKWYREHYDWSRRLGAVWTLVWHYINRYLWRHGESAGRLLLNAAIAALVVFPLLLFVDRGALSPGADSFRDCVWLSLSNFMSVDRLSPAPLGSDYLRAVSGFEALAGIVFAGLFVSLFVKALLRR